MGKTLYEILAVSPSASSEEIEAACLRLADSYRTDRTADQESAKRFAEIERAYQVLLNPAKRAAYNKEALNTEDYLRSIPMGVRFVARTWQEAVQFDDQSVQISQKIMDLEGALAQSPSARHIENAMTRLQKQLEDREQVVRVEFEKRSGKPRR